MTPDHPRWREFVEELSRSCICTGSVENARRVLSARAGIDVGRSLEAIRILGGSCDCAIVFELGGIAARTPV
jgi:hypothetical protein